MTIRTAACSCGQLHLKIDGDPMRVSVCHCLACQRRTGSVFGAQARFPKKAVQVFGSSRAYVRVGDSGHRITFQFCPQCGSTVHYAIEVHPDLIAVPLGVLADPHFPPPRFSVYEDRQHRWVALPAGMEHLP